MQDPDRQIIAPTVFQDVAFGPVNLGLDDQAVRMSVAQALRHSAIAVPPRARRRGRRGIGRVANTAASARERARILHNSPPN